jgi:hypothetical protein
MNIPRKFRTLPAAVIALAAFATLGLGVSHGQTITSTVSEDNGATNSAGDGNQAIYDVGAANMAINHPAIVNSGQGAANTGYDFSGGANNFTNLGGTISQITFAMTMQDGNSGSAAQQGVADFDFNHLFLYLAAPSAYNSTTGVLTGGVNTGIVLNGFRGLGLQDTQTFTMSIDPGTTGAAIVTELTTGAGHLDAFVVSDNPMDTVVQPNEVFVGNDAKNATTTLTLSAMAVPEPTSCALFGLGTLLIVGPQVRRFRRNI